MSLSGLLSISAVPLEHRCRCAGEGPFSLPLHPSISHGTWSLVLGSGEDEIAEDNPESQEMLEEQLVRMLTREVMDLISKWRGGAREAHPAALHRLGLGQRSGLISRS